MTQLDSTTSKIEVLQKSIEALEPQVKTASDAVAKEAAQVQVALEATDEQKENMKQNETTTAEHKAIASELAESCANIMQEAVPLLDEAEATLHTLTPADVTFIRTMKNPAFGVKVLMEAICILKDIKPEKIATPSGNGSAEDFWNASKKLLGDSKFLESLINFEKDNIPPEILKKLQEKILTNELLDPEKLKLISVACEALCKWVCAIVRYGKAFAIVAPKRIALKEAEDLRDVSFRLALMIFHF